MVAAADTVVRSIHLIAAAVWAGGLVFLGVAVAAARRTVPERTRIELFRTLGRWFALVGGLSLLLLVITGIDMGADHLSSWSDLVDDGFGRRLSEKLALVAAVIVLTAVHSFIQGPALSRLRERAVERPDDAELRALIRRKSVRSGVVSALTLLATLAVLVQAARLVAA